MKTIYYDDISDEDQEILEAHGVVFEDGEATFPDTLLETGCEKANGWLVDSYELDGIRFERGYYDPYDQTELHIVGKGK